MSNVVQFPQRKPEPESDQVEDDFVTLLGWSADMGAFGHMPTKEVG
jgi:hypothetical protein